MKTSTGLHPWTTGLLSILAAANVGSAPVLPHFQGSSFIPGAAVTNTYFPMTSPDTRVFEGSFEDEGETVVERFELTNLGLTGPILLGVPTWVQRDRAYENDLLVEDTFDYYAQDTGGNVWYFGEDVTNYVYDDDDNLVETNSESSWLAGVNSALPGYIMPADLTQAYNYYQEFAPFDAAMDHGTTLASDREISVPYGDFADVLAVLEGNPSEPDVRAIKYFAPGFGLIAEEEGLDFSLMNPELPIGLIDVVPAAVPVPAALPLFAASLLGLFGISRSQRTV